MGNWEWCDDEGPNYYPYKIPILECSKEWKGRSNDGENLYILGGVILPKPLSIKEHWLGEALCDKKFHTSNKPLKIREVSF